MEKKSVRRKYSIVNAYNRILIEISGRCNAKCKWCVTGIKNYESPQTMPSMKKNVMTFALFEKVVKHLLEEEIADENTMFSLYNWGEPLLNPEFYEILLFLQKNQLKYNLSTNVSIPLKPINNKVLFSTLQSITFSYCGFSQKSYDRIHHFNFEQIKEHTEKMIDTLRANGFRGHAMMAYHIYQFNQGVEMAAARRFCKELGISFSPSYAYINNFNQAKLYLQDKLDYATLKDMGKELCFHYLDSLIKQRPQEYQCKLLDSLVIDENARIVPCCAVQDEILGDLLKCTKEDIEKLKKEIKSCAKCKEIGLDYWSVNPPTLLMQTCEYLDTNCTSLFLNQNYVIFGAGEEGKKASKHLKKHGGVVHYFIDSDSCKQGKSLEGIPIKSLEDYIKDDKKLVVLIGSDRYKEEMKKVLVKENKIENQDFYYYKDLICKS